MVCQIGNVLRNDKGVKKGDLVVVYMPVCPLAVASMLACARIGAVHRCGDILEVHNSSVDSHKPCLLACMQCTLFKICIGDFNAKRSTFGRKNCPWYVQCHDTICMIKHSAM